jgi:hypothetical protein
MYNEENNYHGDDTFYTDISFLGGVFAKNISQETKHFPC